MLYMACILVTTDVTTSNLATDDVSCQPIIQTFNEQGLVSTDCKNFSEFLSW